MHRRQFLRGVFGGAAVSVALPPLLSLPGTAHAAADAFPCRFGLFFWGNGILPERWIPTDTGLDYTLSDELAPLASVRDLVTVLSGFEVKVSNEVAHGSGPAGLLSGRPALDRGDNAISFDGPSLDQVAAEALGGSTPFRSLEVGVQPGAVGRSFRGVDLMNPPESDPVALHQRLFGPSFREPGEDGVVDPRLALRRSVLDAVLVDAADLRKRVGRADQLRLDEHLSAVRELEQRIARLEEDPPELAACSRAEAPSTPPALEGRPQMGERARIMADLSVMALACDQTRVLSFWYSDPLNDLLYPQATAGHHQLTHDEPGGQPTVHRIVVDCMTAWAYLVDKLASVPEGDGTLLDHMALLGTTDVSYGRTHSIDDFPMLVAGGAGGLTPAGHVRSPTKDNAGRVPFTLLQALGVTVPAWGEGDVATSKALTEVLS